LSRGDLRDLLSKKAELLKYDQLSLYDPYQFQVDFHNDKDDRVGLIASNQTGKSRAGCVQDAFDLTGYYPDWYEGVEYSRPVRIVCGGINNDKTRDLLQNALLGNPVEKEISLGTGWIPMECLDKSKISLKRGVTNAFGHCMVKHHKKGKAISGIKRGNRYFINDGWSQLTFSSYVAGKEAWMGDTIDLYHGDEECKMDILGQMGRGCIATNGRIRMTFTPENGTTDVLNKVKHEWSCHHATFADVAGEGCEYEFEDGEVLRLEPVYTMRGRIGHINKKTITNLEKDNPPWMMKTRMMGLPCVGEGLVFAFMESQISCNPIEFPSYFKFIDAIDFGGSSSTSHPTAFIRLAYDPQNDVIYIYDGFRVTGKEIPEISALIVMKPNTDIIPVIWPHDGNKTLGKGAATTIQYREAGVNMFETHFTNPADEESGKQEGQGGINILPGITEMSGRFNDGRLKIFSTFVLFFDEYRNYHMADGNIVDVGDDLMSSSRYGVQSIRHAVTLERKSIVFNQRTGTNSASWMGG